jgi:hypothetical protein
VDSQVRRLDFVYKRVWLSLALNALLTVLVIIIIISSLVLYFDGYLASAIVLIITAPLTIILFIFSKAIKKGNGIAMFYHDYVELKMHKDVIKIPYNKIKFAGIVTEDHRASSSVMSNLVTLLRIVLTDDSTIGIEFASGDGAVKSLHDLAKELIAEYHKEQADQ